MLKQHLLLTLIVSLLWYSGNAQTDDRLAPSKIPLASVQQLVLPPLDNEILLEDELAQRIPGRAPRFAQAQAVDITPNNSGTWEWTTDGRAVWRMRIKSVGAKSLNLGFDEFKLPAEAQLFLYSPDYSHVQGPFVPADNEEHGELWTPIVFGDEIVIELSLPIALREEYQLHLKTVNHDFLGFGTSSAMSGSCNLDVICGENDGYEIIERYRDIIQSVAVYSAGGETICTGFLISNTRRDCTPLFMTANHCGLRENNAASLVVYWNYLNSTCRTPNSPISGEEGNGSLNDFNSGATLRASYTPTDMSLLELDDEISETANAWFAGWDARPVQAPDTVVCIHHPNTEEKRISFAFGGTYRSDSNGNRSSSGNFVGVDRWNIGTTEGGSSGSPIFNKGGQVIGQLLGGRAACGNNEYDVYGWVNRSWNGGGSDENRLSNWLDPDNIGILQQAGYGQGRCELLAPDFTQQSICAPSVAAYNIEVSDLFEAPVNLSVSDAPAGMAIDFSTNPVVPGGTTQLTLGNTQNVAPGTYLITLRGSDGTSEQTTFLSVSVYNGRPSQPELLTPNDVAIIANFAPLLSWETQQNVASYRIQITRDEDFNTVLIDTDTFDAEYSTGSLVGGYTYYWRVQANNSCNNSDWSPTFSFFVDVNSCGILGTSDNRAISSGSPSVSSTSFIIDDIGTINSIRVNVNIEHSFVGDLSAKLRSPSGNEIQLFNQPGNGNCSRNDIQVTFDDNASNTANDFVNTCDENPAISGIFQPVDALGAFHDEEARGEWTLLVSDAVFEDGGRIRNWSLDICTDASEVVNTSHILANTQWQVWPNPTTDQLQLTLADGLDGSLQATLFATNGQAVSQWLLNPQQGQQPLDLRDVPAGIYWLRLTHGSAHATERIVILD